MILSGNYFLSACCCVIASSRKVLMPAGHKKLFHVLNSGHQQVDLSDDRKKGARVRASKSIVEVKGGSVTSGG